MITETIKAKEELREEIERAKKEALYYFNKLPKNEVEMGKKLIKEYYKASKWNINKPLKGTDETREEISRRKGIEEVFDNLFKTFNLSRKKFTMWLWSKELEEALKDDEFEEIKILRSADYSGEEYTWGYLAFEEIGKEDKYYIYVGTSFSDKETYFDDIYRFYYVSK